MSRAIVPAIVLGVLFIIVGGGYALHGTPVAYAADPPPPRVESGAELVLAAVQGCASAGGTWTQGVEDGVLVGRCHPLPNVGVIPAVSRRKP